MWDKDKSVILSVVIIKALYPLIAACCVAAPFLAGYYDETVVLARGEESLYVPLLVTLYSIVPPAVAAVVSLDRLLGNIRRGQPFIARNVSLLRVISWCCFAVAALFVWFSCMKPFGFAVVFAAAFFGVIIRVVKNCFQQAVALREENDLTV